MLFLCGENPRAAGPAKDDADQEVKLQKITGVQHSSPLRQQRSHQWTCERHNAGVHQRHGPNISIAQHGLRWWTESFYSCLQDPGRKSKIPAKETLMNSFGLDLNSNGASDKGKDEREPEQTIGLDDDTSSQIGLMESDLTTEIKRKQSFPNSGPVELEQLPREQIDRNGM